MDRNGNFGRKVEVVTNVGMLVVAIIIGAIAIKQYVLKPPTPAFIKVGNKVPLQAVNWKGKNLVLAVSDGWHFCSESAAFYKSLMRQIQTQADVQTMAILPQAVEAGRSYLDRLGIAVNDVRQVRLSDVPIGGTPTLLLVDNEGIVRKTWIGKLGAKAES